MYLELLEIQAKIYWSFEFLISLTGETILISCWSSFSIVLIIFLLGKVFGNFVSISIEGISNTFDWDSLINIFEYEGPIFTERTNSLAIIKHLLWLD